MLAPTDIYVLIGTSVIAPDRAAPYRELSDQLGVPIANLQRSFHRLERAKLVRRDRRPNLGLEREFLLHSAQFIAPADLGGIVRGFPTAWAAPPLAGRFVDQGELPPVWPSLDGPERGREVEPLHKSAVMATARNPKLAEVLALVDALRIGDARVRGVASELLEQRLEGLAGQARVSS